MAGVWVGVTSGLWAAGLAEAGSAASVEGMLEVSAGGASEVWAASSVEGGLAEATLEILAEVTSEVWAAGSVERGLAAAEFTEEAIWDSLLASASAVTMTVFGRVTAVRTAIQVTAMGTIITITATTDARSTHPTDGDGPPTATDAPISRGAAWRRSEPHAVHPAMVPAYANRVSSQTLWR